MTSVEVRYLSGDHVYLGHCSSVGSVMVRTAMMHDRFATEVSVIIPDTGELLADIGIMPPPVVCAVFLPDGALADDDLLKLNIRLHAEEGDYVTCKRALGMMVRECNIEEMFLVDGSKNGEDIMLKTLLRLKVPHGNALVRFASEGRSWAVDMLLRDETFEGSDNGSGTNAALLSACVGGHACIVGMLLSVRANGNYSDIKGNSALLYAALGGWGHVVETLLAASANANHVNGNGCSALLNGAFGGHREVVKMLLDARADANHSNQNGCSAVSYAREKGYMDVVDLLGSAGDSHEDTNCVTAAAAAPRTESEEAVEMLLSPLVRKS